MSGADELGALAADLEGASRKVAAGARLAIRKAVTDIQAGAQGRAPVETGNLKSSITTEMQGNGAYARGEVGPTANYGAFVENGTSRMRAQPYLRPATDAVLPGYEEALAQLGVDAINSNT